jgi:hypothetical protein
VRTPAGQECPYFYGDYRRGRNTEECRLIEAGPGEIEWRPPMCQSCPVPRIVMANACPHMHLRAKIGHRWLGFVQQVEVTAYCDKAEAIVDEPEVGCGQCHDRPLPDF